MDWAGLAGLCCLTEYGHPSFPQNLHLVVVRLLPKDKEAHPLSSRELRPFKDILAEQAGAVNSPLERPPENFQERLERLQSELKRDLRERLQMTSEVI